MKVYLIFGKARHGKDTTANYMKKYYEQKGYKPCIMHIGNYIKHFAKDYFGWDGKEETKPRELLQQLGTNVIREKLNKPYFFTTRLLEDMEVLKNFYNVFLIADVRLPLEIIEIKKVYNDSVIIKVERENFETELTSEQQKHITEVGLDDFNDYNYKLINTTFDKLEEQVTNLIRKEELK